MEITKKIFWRQAIKSGTLIGLVSVGFGLLKYALHLGEMDSMLSVVNILAIVVFISMVYGFTKRMSRMSLPSQGFPYGRCIGFVAAMMIFAGIIEGTYTAIVNNFIAPELALEAIDYTMLMFQDKISDYDFDAMYSMMKRISFNPIWIVISSIIGNLFWGFIVSLFTSISAKRNPDIFAE